MPGHSLAWALTGLSSESGNLHSLKPRSALPGGALALPDPARVGARPPIDLQRAWQLAQPEATQRSSWRATHEWQLALPEATVWAVIPTRERAGGEPERRVHPPTSLCRECGDSRTRSHDVRPGGRPTSGNRLSRKSRCGPWVSLRVPPGYRSAKGQAHAQPPPFDRRPPGSERGNLLSRKPRSALPGGRLTCGNWLCRKRRCGP